MGFSFGGSKQNSSSSSNARSYVDKSQQPYLDDIRLKAKKLDENGMPVEGVANLNSTQIAAMNNANTALNFMLLQSGDDGFDSATVVVFPAWPCTWDVDFKLAAPLNTTVSVRYVKGKLERFDVEPTARKSAVTFAGCVT